MLIDWFTVVAQILNFLILIGLLKYFLYKPILEAVDAREKQIADQVGQAEKLNKEAGESLGEFQRKNMELDKNSTTLMNSAIREADTERTRLLQLAQKENETFKSNFISNFEKEQHNLIDTIARKTQERVFLVAKKVLSDIASISMEDQIVKAFINRMQNSTPEEKKSYLVLLLNNNAPIVIKSAFELSTPQRELIESKMQETFSIKPDLKFHTDPSLISGIECFSRDHKLCWNIAEYFTSLETLVTTDVAEVLL